MTKTEIISTLTTIRDDLYLTKVSLEVGTGEYIIIKSRVAGELVDKINNIPNSKRKDVISIIKHEYVKAYSKMCYTVDNREENEVIYLFMKQIVALLNIKM